jgi:5-(carboxyamino)imidazole ribonucleotide synthase
MLWSAAGLVVLLLVIIPFLRWYFRTYTVTTRRVVAQSGVFGRAHQIGTPRLHDRERRGPIQRMWGRGPSPSPTASTRRCGWSTSRGPPLNEALADQVEVSQILAHRDSHAMPVVPRPAAALRRPLTARRRSRGIRRPGKMDADGKGCHGDPRNRRRRAAGRMMIAPAVELGIDVRVLAEEPGMSAALAATATGDYRDLETVRAFARGVDVVTFDHEHVPQEVLRALVADGVAVHPGPTRCSSPRTSCVCARASPSSAPQPEWAAVTDAAQLQAFLDANGGRAVVKTPRGGYDGKGVRVVSHPDEVADWFGDGPLLAEELVDFARELAQQVARRPSGDIVAYPVVETVQRGGVCAEVIAPAPHPAARLAEVAAQIGTAIAEGLGVTGMLAVELFETTDERLLVNELAMRPHNSGHWGRTAPSRGSSSSTCVPCSTCRSATVAAAAVGRHGQHPRRSVSDSLESRPAALAAPRGQGAHYGKAPRPGRKVGHVNATGDDLDAVVYDARAAAAFFAD